MPLAEVKTLYASNARQIPEMLRKLADRIEAGDVKAQAMVSIIKLDDDVTEMYSWGDADAYRALALYQLAVWKLSRILVP